PGPPPGSSERSERPGEGYSQRATGDGVSASQRVLVWFHGNAGNVGHRLPFAQALVTSFGLDVVLVDYRGYGRSDGVPSEAGLYLDGRAMYAAATERGFAPEQIVLFGESLGAAVALDVAAEHPSGALIVEAPFLSIPAMARVVYPFLPTRLITTRFDNEAKIARVTVPKLFLQAERDEIVPPAQTRRLYELAPAPKEYAVIPRATHNTMFRDGGADYLEAWRRFLHRDQPIG
ncbi:MAG TPA: alpha/beta hydrolase, partial [Chloroflexota bacterium]|nr:alpha/beta hydrolase [Chloroflexota bacterium]